MYCNRAINSELAPTNSGLQIFLNDLLYVNLPVVLKKITFESHASKAIHFLLFSALSSRVAKLL